MSLSTKIIIGLLAGIAIGLFFGEMVAWMDIPGKAFVLLLQMAVLPYVTFSLIAGLGGLQLEQAKMLAIKGGIMLLVTWVIAFAIILLMPLAFPSRVAASFFSSALIEAPKQIDLLNLYIPANPFNSLANNLVPAVVVFSIATGVALIGVANKAVVLDPLKVLTQALTSVTGFVVRLTPYGVFFLAASAAGTMSVDEFERLQVYLLTFVAGCMLATLWILPGLVAALTPFRYRDILNMTKDAMLTAFSTGNLFVILPILVENSKQLFEKYQVGDENTQSLVDIVVPVSFNFPNAGKLMMMVFVLFAGWFTGSHVSLGDYPSFVASGLVTFFGSVNVAIPFLLDSLQIPADMFQLFLVSTVVNTRFATILAAMHVLFLALTVTCALSGLIQFSAPKLLRFLVITAIVTAATILASRLYLTTFVSADYQEAKVVRSMELQTTPVSSQVFKAPPPPLTPTPGQSGLDAVRERGMLRVGYHPDRLPHSFFNATGELVGLDVEMAHMLAEELDVALQFAPFDPVRIGEELDLGYYDVVMSGLVGETSLYQKVQFTHPYMDITLAFAVRDDRRQEFVSIESIKKMDELTIALPGKHHGYFADLIRDAFPKAKLVELDSPRDFFESGRESIDAMLVSAEGGSTWTLLYPKYAVAVPLPAVVTYPLGFAVQANDMRFTAFLNNWILLKKTEGTIQRIYDYWILGENAVPQTPRWSVIRDVLHWVD